MSKHRFIKNIIILGISGIIAKLFDFCFRAYYSHMLGAEGMGLLSLGFSLHSVMLTFSTAGLGVAVSKTVSEYMELKKPNAVKCCMHDAMYGVVVLSISVIIITFIFSPYLANNILGDSRVSTSLCTLAPSVIFMGISYCLKGCFYAQRKILPPASSEILEQIVKFISIRTLLKFFLPYGIEYGCAAVFAGISIGEFSSCAYLCIFYLREEKNAYGFSSSDDICPENKDIICRLLGVSLPSMITSLCSSGFRMQEEVLIVSAFERGGLSHSSAIQSLGIIHGMAMPLLVLPLNLAGSVMSLLVPEFSRAGTHGKQRLRHTAIKVYKAGIGIGCLISIIFLLFGHRLSYIFYGTDAASKVVVYLAPLCPIMFMDSLSCSILNGMGKQVRMLVFSILDFTLRFSVIYFILPYGKMSAFILMVALSNIFTCSLTLGSVVSAIYSTPLSKLTKTKKCGILK